MNRRAALALGIGGGLVAATGLAIVMAAPTKGPVFIPGDKPVTEEQVRQQLQADGWTNFQVIREGRYFEAIASKQGQSRKFVVDSQTGRLRANDEDDDDD